MAQTQKLFSNKDLKKLILPFFFEQLLLLMVGVSDTFMVSYAGEAAVSGVSLVNMLVVFFIYVFTALASGGAVMVSQYLGARQKEKAEKTAGQLLLISIIFSLLSTAVLLIWNRPVLQLFFGRVEPDVMDACLTYQKIMAYSFIGLGIYNTGAAVCRSINKTGVTLRISILANIINVAGNAIGIFVLHAGVAGVAWPTFLSRIFSAAAVVWFCTRPYTLIQFHWKNIFPADKQSIHEILHVAVPNSIENGAFQMIKIALSSITALFGTAQIAANGIAQSIWSLSSIMVITMGPVYITVIGQCMGAGEVEQANYYFKKLMKITSLASLVWDGIIFALTPLLMQYYALSDTVRNLVIQLVLIHNLFNGFVWPFGGALPFGLRAAGDIRFTMVTSIASTVLVRMVLSVVLGIYLDMGVIGIAYAMVADWTVRAVIFYLRWRQGKWRSMKLIAA